MDNHKCRRYSPIKDKECLALTLADTDFAFPSVVKSNIDKMLDKGDLSYTFLEKDFKESISQWYSKRFNIDISNENICVGNGVIYWIQVAIHSYTKEGDGIIIQPPVYNPFIDVIKECNRKVVKSPLVFKNNVFTIDFKDLEEKFKVNSVFLFCNPHNPTGNVWKEEDILKILELAKKYDVLIIADEIWQDLIFEEGFNPIVKYKNIWRKIISISSPAKTFNMGGMQFGHIIIPNKEIHGEINDQSISHFHYSSSNAITQNIVQTVYTNELSEKWLDEKFKPKLQLQRNRLMYFLRENDIEHSASNSTFLIWAKIGSGEFIEKEALDKLLRKNNLHITLGDQYGEAYRGWARINIGISDEDMAKLIRRLERVLDTIESSKNNAA
ncbi:aminotransferase class I/II-fold pyridoxal phosphate-dependent enzyme [Mycoplasma todarodis]|nr:aminotransferase class I/II-fold pyridoxal phosphate-dependent enzyme [Mycoplasma todarodis]